MNERVFHLIFGLLFGLILSRSGAGDYQVVQGMFLFEDFQLYGVIGVAIMVIAPGLWLLKRRGIAFDGTPLVITEKARHGGNLLGGALFGVGWSLTGMCPGPIFVNIGEGKVYAIAVLAGALVGAGLMGVLYPRLERCLGLPRLEPKRPTP